MASGSARRFAVRVRSSGTCVKVIKFNSRHNFTYCFAAFTSLITKYGNIQLMTVYYFLYKHFSVKLCGIFARLLILFCREPYPLRDDEPCSCRLNSKDNQACFRFHPSYLLKVVCFIYNNLISLRNICTCKQCDFDEVLSIPFADVSLRPYRHKVFLKVQKTFELFLVLAETHLEVAAGNNRQDEISVTLMPIKNKYSLIYLCIFRELLSSCFPYSCWLSPLSFNLWY